MEPTPGLWEGGAFLAGLALSVIRLGPSQVASPLIWLMFTRVALWEAGLSHFLSSPRMGLSWCPEVRLAVISLPVWEIR